MTAYTMCNNLNSNPVV